MRDEGKKQDWPEMTSVNLIAMCHQSLFSSMTDVCKVSYWWEGEAGTWHQPGVPVLRRHLVCPNLV